MSTIKNRLIKRSAVFFRCAFLILTSFGMHISSAQVVLNNYAAVLKMDPCTNTFTVDTATAFHTGDTVLVIQMKGAAIDTSNTASFGTITDYGHAGNYEINTVSAVSGHEITLLYALSRSYDIPEGKVQIVRIPFYQNYTISSTHTCLPWNGSKGGVFALFVADELTLSSDVDVSGKGFRGGAESQSFYASNACSETGYYFPQSPGRGGEKGESIHVNGVGKTHGRGRSANGGGGGNSVNSGGAGGGNFGAGGRGGDQWSTGSCTRIANGGDEARALGYSNAVNTIFAGGGGGGGQQNDRLGSAGTNGGGIVIIQAGRLAGNNGKIIANGINNLVVSANDGSGGAGSGGTILLDIGNTTGVCTLEARGGNGGGYNHGGCHGTGGGGGGGVLWTSAAVPATWNTDIAGGQPGWGPCGTGSHGATPGEQGGLLTGLAIPRNTRVFTNPVENPDIAYNGPLCTGDTLRILLNNVYSQAASYTWTGPNMFSSNQRNPVIGNVLPLHSGTYVVGVEVDGCFNMDSISVVVGDKPVVNLGNDTGICLSSVPYMLQSTYPATYHHLWSNGLSGTQMEVHNSGTYWLQIADINGCSGSDTVRIKVTPDPYIYIGADTIICEQFPLRIGSQFAEASYLWNTDEQTPYIHVNRSGIYVLALTLDGCTVYDTIDITAMPVPDINLGGDRDICPEETIVLSGIYQPGSRYVWNTGDTTVSYAATSAGTYRVEVVSEHGCIGHDEVTLSYYPEPDISLGYDTVVCEETPLRVVAWTINADSVRWSDGSVGHTLDIRYGGSYTATAINKCGSDSDTINVRQIFCEIWVPNAFTPNGDGVNDVFRILGNTGRLEGVSFSIYNRWGEQLFLTQDKYKGWDGYYKYVPAQIGTYVYLLEYSVDGHPYKQTGNFHLLR